MDRWGVYETLKGTRKINIKEIEKTDAEEVKEGLIEFLLSRTKDIEGD